MRNLTLVFCLASALVWVAPALAADAPAEPDKPKVPIDMGVKLLDDKGVAIKDLFLVTKDDPDCLKCGDLTLGMAVFHAALRPQKEDQNNTEATWTREHLADRVKADPAAVLTAGERDLLTATMIKVYPLMGEYGLSILNRAIPLIDPNKEPPKLK